jgi:integrase
VGQLVELYSRVREPNLAGSTVKNYRIALRALEEIAGTHTPLSSINRERCRQIRDTLAGLPSNYRKLPQTRDMSITDAVAAGRKLKLPTVKPATLNGYTTKLCALFKLAVKEEWVASNPATDLTVNDPVSPKQKRHPFSSEQLDAIFAGEPWASNERDVDGRPARFWLPILALYTGARLGELAQLATADVGMRSGVQVIEVRAGDETRLKTDNAERTIPVHSELVRMGFLKFVEEARNAARPRLFPQELRNGLGQYGRGVSDWFARLLDRRGITDKKLTFHSFRHNFEDALRDADLHGGPIGAYLSGRSVGGVAASYGDGYSATKLRDAIERVQYPDLDLSHLHHAPVD